MDGGLGCARLNSRLQKAANRWREAVLLWLIVILNALTILISFRKRVLLFALHYAIFVFLVTGQAFQIQGDLDRSHTVYYLFNFISDAGFHLAVWYIFGVSLVAFLLAVFSKGYRQNSLPPTEYVFDPGRGFYFWLLVFQGAISFVLIFAVIGLNEFLHSSRPGYQSGSTIFIVLLFLGVVPFLLKIMYPGKIGFGDIACLLLTFGVTGMLSRTHLVLYLVAILSALYYARGWADRPHTLALFGKISVFGILVGGFILGIGALHDAQNFTQGSLGDLVSYVLKNPEKSVLSIDYNYRIGIEGMSGTAGALSHYIGEPYAVHLDYGASWMLKGATQWLPGFLKTFANALIDFSDSLNWHADSIVASGVESFFVSFGWSAVLLYPLATWLLGWHLPLKIVTAQVAPRFKVAWCVVAAWTIMFVHGALAVWIAFSVSYGLLILFLWPVFGRQMKAKHRAGGSVSAGLGALEPA